MYQVPFSEDTKDQIRLQESGGYIAFKANGAIVFQFDSRESYQKYMEGKNNEKNTFATAHY
ncbi:hypothetical protein [Caenibacillus caldisaponilyticus]|uniref:hypothetical protein n=1 Tax=Caenibacillus caldisaponilyticus TaxID=1674942 RepID=UPI000988592C|nr:hypothetical protein [Caenibacillus caldisaponilyticus]